MSAKGLRVAMPDQMQLSSPTVPMTSVPGSGDPSPLENPGQPYTQDSLWCETCGKVLTDSDWTGLMHIGHSTRIGNPEYLPDVGDFGQTMREGGAYRIQHKADGVVPQEGSSTAEGISASPDELNAANY